MKSDILLLQGDCIEELKDIQEPFVDLVLTDPPYGTTQCKWDTIIPLEPMWELLLRVTKPTTPICLFGAEPFSSKLRVSNLEMFKYDWVWQKDKATNHLNAKRQPMRRNEIISVFYRKQCLYQPQLKQKDPRNIRPDRKPREQAENYGKMTAASKRAIPLNMTYPNETLKFRSCSGDKGKSLHPTQKPVDLLEYLIKTYTREGDVVLDFAMGSGSTGVACRNLNRNFIGIEKEQKYFNIAQTRINYWRR